MFQLFLRARARNYFKTRLRNQDFRARAADRDAETDGSRVSSILRAIENALHAAGLERSGLNRRVEDVLARAAVTMGNGTDEYLEREPLDSYHQDLFSAEISNGGTSSRSTRHHDHAFQVFEGCGVEQVSGL